MNEIDEKSTMDNQIVYGHKKTMSIEQLERILLSIENQKLDIFIGNTKLTLVSYFSFECELIYTGKNYIFYRCFFTSDSPVMINKKEVKEASIDINKNGKTDLYIGCKNGIRFNIVY